MTNDKVEPMVSYGRRDIPVPVWAVSIINVLFIAAGVGVAVLVDGFVGLGVGAALVVAGLSGLVSIMVSG